MNVPTGTILLRTVGSGQVRSGQIIVVTFPFMKYGLIMCCSTHLVSEDNVYAISSPSEDFH